MENPREIIHKNPFHSPSLAWITTGHSGDGEGSSSFPSHLRPSDHTMDLLNDDKEEFVEEEDENKRSDLRARAVTGRVLRPRVQVAEEDINDKKMTSAELHFTLSKDEIEADFITMTGSKPPRRSKRKHKTSVQKRLNSLSPGFLLPPTISADRYKVSDLH